MKHFQRHIYFILLACCVVTIGLFSDGLSDLLRYDRHLIEKGEIWRMITAHFTHLTWSHLSMNLAGFALVFAFFGNLISNLHWTFFTFFSAVFISLVLYITNPGLIWYVGLSGILHGLLVLGGLHNYKVRRWESILFLSLIFAKLFWEQFYGALPGSEKTAGGPVLVDAHFYGAISAIIWFIGVILFRTISKSSAHN